MPLLEIIRTEKTSPQVIVDLLDVAKKIKKTSIVVGNCTGFAVNRMFFPYSQAAMLLTERGAAVYHIDQSIKSFGMPMGPFRCMSHVLNLFKIIRFYFDYTHHWSRNFILKVAKTWSKSAILRLIFFFNIF